MQKQSSVSHGAIKFGIIVVLGLVIDLGVGFLLTTWSDLSLPLCAVIGFLGGAIFNYVMHEKWTFASADSALSATRASYFLAATLVVLIVRVSAAYLLSPFATGRLSSLSVLIASAGISFVVNYLLSRFVVYRRPTRTPSE